MRKLVLCASNMTEKNATETRKSSTKQHKKKETRTVSCGVPCRSVNGMPLRKPSSTLSMCASGHRKISSRLKAKCSQRSVTLGTWHGDN